MHGDDNIDCTTRVQSVESLVIHGVADKVACLSKATRLHLLYLLASLVFMQSMTSENRTSFISCEHFNKFIHS